MADIQYKWGIECGENCKSAVDLAKNLELPQFKVKGHKQMQKVEILSTGKQLISQNLTLNHSETHLLYHFTHLGKRVKWFVMTIILWSSNKGEIYASLLPGDG